MSGLIFGSDSEEEMFDKTDYIEQLNNVHKNNGFLDLSMTDLPRYDIFKGRPRPCHFNPVCYNCMLSEPTKSESVFDASDSTQNSSRTSKNEDATIPTPPRKKKRTPRQKVFSEAKPTPDKISSLSAEAKLAHCAASPLRSKV